MATAPVTAVPTAHCGGARATRPLRPPPQPTSGHPPCAPPPGQAPLLMAMSRMASGSTKAKGRVLRG
eukprot:6020131-Alexandrium_andersonii.AAC.1